MTEKLPIDLAQANKLIALKCECDKQNLSDTDYKNCKAKQAECYQPYIQELNKRKQKRNQAKVGIYALILLPLVIILFVIVYVVLRKKGKNAALQAATKS